MKKLVSILISLAFVLLLVNPVWAVSKFWWGSCLTGGGDCLDGIDGATITTTDGALVMVDVGSVPQIYFYRCYESSATESSPNVITPDSNPGTKRWHLVNIYGTSFNTPSLDGYNQITIANNTTRAPTESAMEIYPEANVWKLNQNGTEYAAVIAPSAGQVSFTGPTSTARAYVLPNESSLTIVTNSTAQTLELVTSGSIRGAIKIVTKTDDGVNSITAAEALGSMVLLGHGDAISDLALPDYTTAAAVDKAKIGSSVCVYAISAYAHTIHPGTGDKIRTSNGTLNAAGAGVTYTTESTPIGGYVCFVLTDEESSDVGIWTQWGMRGTWPIH